MSTYSPGEAWFKPLLQDACITRPRCFIIWINRSQSLGTKNQIKQQCTVTWPVTTVGPLILASYKDKWRHTIVGFTAASVPLGLNTPLRLGLNQSPSAFGFKNVWGKPDPNFITHLHTSRSLPPLSKLWGDIQRIWCLGCNSAAMLFEYSQILSNSQGNTILLKFFWRWNIKAACGIFLWCNQQWWLGEAEQWV